MAGQLSVPASGCVLCEQEGGQPIWRGAEMRVIRAQEAGFPAFYRVIWNAHVAELSDLGDDERERCMRAVTVVERAVRDVLAPTKINLAALGNMVPHLHWHVIARHDWDSHFPGAVWAAAQRERDAAREAAVAERLPALDMLLRERLQAQFG